MKLALLAGFAASLAIGSVYVVERIAAAAMEPFTILELQK